MNTIVWTCSSITLSRAHKPFIHLFVPFKSSIFFLLFHDTFLGNNEICFCYNWSVSTFCAWWWWFGWLLLRSLGIWGLFTWLLAKLSIYHFLLCLRQASCSALKRELVRILVPLCSLRGLWNCRRIPVITCISWACLFLRLLLTFPVS
jgi:hypothetical protein